jgi:WD40 repeat protein
VLVAGDDSSVRAFNINIKDESRKWDGHKEAVVSLAISLVTRQAASGSYDGEVILWNVDDGKVIRRFQATPGHEKASPAK